MAWATVSCRAWVSRLTLRPVVACSTERTRKRKSSACRARSTSRGGLVGERLRPQQPQQADGFEIPQRARRFLHVRFELVNGAGGSGRDAPPSARAARRATASPVPRDRCRAGPTTCSYSGLSPARKRRSRSARSSSGLPDSIWEKSASSRTCWPTVRRRSQSGCSRPLTKRSSGGPIAPAVDDQEVDIRVEAEGTPSVAADRADRDGHRGLRAGAVRDLAHQAVHPIGVACEHVQAGAPFARTGRTVSPRLGEEAPQSCAVVCCLPVSARAGDRVVGRAHGYHRHDCWNVRLPAVRSRSLERDTPRA